MAFGSFDSTKFDFQKVWIRDTQTDTHSDMLNIVIHRILSEAKQSRCSLAKIWDQREMSSFILWYACIYTNMCNNQSISLAARMHLNNRFFSTATLSSFYAHLFSRRNSWQVLLSKWDRFELSIETMHNQTSVCLCLMYFFSSQPQILITYTISKYVCQSVIGCTILSPLYLF